MVLTDGAVQVLYVVDNGKWQDAGPITPSGFAPPGAPITGFIHGPNEQVDTTVIGEDGRLYLMWDEGGTWQSPIPLSEPIFSPGGAVPSLSWPMHHHRIFAIANQSTMHADAPGTDSWNTARRLF